MDFAHGRSERSQILPLQCPFPPLFLIYEPTPGSQGDDCVASHPFVRFSVHFGIWTLSCSGGGRGGAASWAGEGCCLQLLSLCWGHCWSSHWCRVGCKVLEQAPC